MTSEALPTATASDWSEQGVPLTRLGATDLVDNSP